LKFQRTLNNESSDLHQYLQNRNSNGKLIFGQFQSLKMKVGKNRAIENNPQNNTVFHSKKKKSQKNFFSFEKNLLLGNLKKIKKNFFKNSF